MATGDRNGFSDLSSIDLKLKGFRVHGLGSVTNINHSSGRRDFYKMGLVTGNMTVLYGEKKYEINDTVLFFINPNIPHSVVRHSENTTGHACLFTEVFFAGRGRTEILKSSPLCNADTSPVVPLNKEQAAFLLSVFQKMQSVHDGNYDHKDELLKNFIELIIHEALSIQSPQIALQRKNAASRVADLFMELLKKQFPIDSTAQPLRLRTAQDFAVRLSVHVNYLNRSVKEVTGKPTSVHIAEHIAAEAKALLLYTNWSVADIAYSLGFEYPTYFNNYFKRLTGVTPKTIRAKKV